MAEQRFGGEVVACPRCRQEADGAALRDGRCPSCGAALVTARLVKEATVRFYMRGRRPPEAAGAGRGTDHAVVAG